jgi:hypothetical protein
LQPPSENAKPLPAHLLHKNCATEHPANETPKIDDPFHDSNSPHVWAEFHTSKPKLPCPLKVDLFKNKQLWYYLGKTSTEAKAQYTNDPSIKVNDPTASFIESVKPVAAPPPLHSPSLFPPPSIPAAAVSATIPRQSFSTSYPQTTSTNVPQRRTTSFSGLQGLNKQSPNFYSDLLKSIQQEKNRINNANPTNNMTHSRTKTVNSRLIGGTVAPKTSVPAIESNAASFTANSKTFQALPTSMGFSSLPMKMTAAAAAETATTTPNNPTTPTPTTATATTTAAVPNPQQSLDDIRRVCFISRGCQH